MKTLLAHKLAKNLSTNLAQDGHRELAKEVETWSKQIDPTVIGNQFQNIQFYLKLLRTGLDRFQVLESVFEEPVHYRLFI